MRHLLAVVAAALLLAVALAGASPAQAASCKKVRYTLGSGEDANVYELFDIATRKVSCRRARDFVRDYERSSNNDTRLECAEGGSCTFRRYRCTQSRSADPARHRCVRGSRVVRWKSRYVGPQ